MSTTAHLPTGGIRLSRTYAQPLPTGVSATMAFYDEQWGAWHAVPSKLSSDRRTVTAVVHHLSLWTDITGAVEKVKKAVSDAVNSAANWAYYQVGKVFDTRVNPPSCSGTPDWVSSSVFIETDKNNPLLFCVGSDPKHASILDVKARVNRGFAYNAYLGPATDWLYNSTFSGMSLDDVVSAIGHLDDDVSQTWGLFSPKGSELVGAGEELSFGATEQQVRNLQGTSTVLRLEPPSTVGFLVSTLGRLVGAQLEQLADGYAAGAIAIAGCYSDVKAAHDAGTWTRAALTCLGGIDEDLAKTLASYLTERGVAPVKAGKLAGAVVGRLTVYLALVGPVFSTMNFALEQRLSDSARTVNVYPQAEQVTASTLRSAEVPADCRLPAQRLKNGKTTEGSPGGGSLVDIVAYGDLAGLGYKQALTAYVCTAGGVTWPQDLVLIGAGGKLLASLNLGRFVQGEHSDLTTISFSGNAAHIAWTTYQGCCFYHVDQAATVSYQSGKLVLSNHTVSYSPEAVAEDVFLAQFEKKRGSLKDPEVVSDAEWTELTTTFGDMIFTVDGSPGTCEVSSQRAVCPVSGDGSNAEHLVGWMELDKDSGSGYGWRVTNLELSVE
ncbi:hypothetical protein [Flexivirga oryzae]|uniref:Uncharacterized protein n=1 Tax=Flexivirga oryzae TaxID=1794944 RepID=A0A839N7K8_9MICO|nr:hypothetical protein [Flexivirga oryzae]MBB2893728.1 hypothetical protein [Flexivirga oryzae]